ncbi:(beta)-carbonic anhydrase [Legionella beliardensis]|uniref:Carbonic anhydrase n=1 Tax=Legionella beliardensis TaxID=91822 RepID=A0A378I4R2_9GAMM|nr:carbonic anhydrase [Legionella beliardensis]STX29686.1 (beta)-carbonic anhydrase [Legionella beliardensis]
MRSKLIDGLEVFKNKGYKKFEELFKLLAQGQSPEVLFITCCDSRIDPAKLTKTKPGDLFIHRNIGNIIPPYPIPCGEAATIEYAVEELQVKEIIICGHSQCGAMKGLLASNLEQKRPSVASWLEHAQQALQVAGRDALETDAATTLRSVIECNILTQIENLKTYSIISEKLQRQEITIQGWYYEFETGKVFIYEETMKKFLPSEKFLNQATQLKQQSPREQTLDHTSSGDLGFFKSTPAERAEEPAEKITDSKDKDYTLSNQTLNM